MGTEEFLRGDTVGVWRFTLHLKLHGGGVLNGTHFEHFQYLIMVFWEGRSQVDDFPQEGMRKGFEASEGHLETNGVLEWSWVILYCDAIDQDPWCHCAGNYKYYAKNYSYNTSFQSLPPLLLHFIFHYCGFLLLLLYYIFFKLIFLPAIVHRNIFASFFGDWLEFSSWFNMFIT